MTIKWVRLLAALALVITGWQFLATSRQESLFAIPPAVTRDPWFQFTILDFYVNALLLYAWVAYRETSWLGRAVWFFALMLGGSLGTLAYILKASFELPPTAPAYRLLQQPEQVHRQFTTSQGL